MTIEWKAGPPPEDEGTWLVWIQGLGERFARRDVRKRLFVLDFYHPPGWPEERITHHHPHKIDRPVTEE